MYLTNPSGGREGGKTVFPEAGVTVTPRQGSVLSFQNVDDNGKPHPNAKHLVSAVPDDAASDRLVVQIPITHKHGVRAFAYPEHVSGAKKPGQHEKMHGTAEQKAAYAAAVAAGASIAVAYMAAKAARAADAASYRAGAGAAAGRALDQRRVRARSFLQTTNMCAMGGRGAGEGVCGRAEEGEARESVCERGSRRRRRCCTFPSEPCHC